MVKPAPFVDFEDFGENSFNFKLYVFCDADKDVGTDLRMAILDAFHEAGIRKMAYLSNHNSALPADQTERPISSPPQVGAALGRA
jgi:small-conductance mechanosensitive channel